MPKPGRIAIIGAGPTGLGAALRLKQLGHEDFRIYEASGRVGGLAASHVDAEGFTWDVGGHVQFSHYEYFDRLMESCLGKEGWLHHERESWVWMRGKFIPYPFQYNIRHLPKQDLKHCLEGLEELGRSPRASKPANFKEWVQVGFGRGIADVFMTPYNEKVWAYPLEDLSYDWIGERVAVTDLKRVQENIRLGRDDRSWGPNNTFRFPLRGGTGAIWRRAAELVGEDRIRLNSAVASVLAAEKTLVFSDGRRETYDVLLNTSPLDDFAAVVVELSDALKRKAKELKYSTTHVVGVGLTGKPKEELSSKCWMYFPEDDCPFYRVTVFSNYSPNNVPDIGRYWSLMAEISESPKKSVDAEKVVADTIQGMVNTKLIEPGQVYSTWYLRAGHGYPTPSIGRDAILSALHPALKSHGIYSRGRFGGWKYEVSNQDHSLMQGVEWAEFLINGTPETTYVDPARANSGAIKGPS